MARETSTAAPFYPVILATAVSVAVYYQQVLLLLLKVGEVFGGVFDTSVPAFPLAGLLFVLVFVSLRWKELEPRLLGAGGRLRVRVAGLAMVVLPLVPLLFLRSTLGASYAYAAIALTTCWVGAMAAVRPPAFRFFLPYLAAYVLAIGSVSLLTAAVGDPLAVIVAGVSMGITSLFHIPVQWSSVYISFVAAGGSNVSLYISQECSGVASVSIFLLLVGLMHLDIRAAPRTTVITAVGGAALFIFLNALRVVGLIAGGIYGSVDLMWSLHGWLGYIFYIVGYSLVVLLYLRTKPRVSPSVPLGTQPVKGQR